MFDVSRVPWDCGTRGVAVMKTLEQTILQLIQYGRARYGASFGNYPLGILDAVKELLPLVDTEQVRKQLADFEERLNRD